MRKIRTAEPLCSRMRLRLSPWRHATEGRATAAVAQVGSAPVATGVADAVAVGDRTRQRIVHRTPSRLWPRGGDCHHGDDPHRASAVVVWLQHCEFITLRRGAA